MGSNTCRNNYQYISHTLVESKEQNFADINKCNSAKQKLDKMMKKKYNVIKNENKIIKREDLMA